MSIHSLLNIPMRDNNNHDSGDSSIAESTFPMAPAPPQIKGNFSGYSSDLVSQTVLFNAPNAQLTEDSSTDNGFTITKALHHHSRTLQWRVNK